MTIPPGTSSGHWLGYWCPSANYAPNAEEQTYSITTNFGAGLFAGSILPGSNRLVVTGFSPAWRGFYVSSLGGAALVFDNLGVSMVSLVGRAPSPSILCLNRRHGEEIEVGTTGSS